MTDDDLAEDVSVIASSAAIVTAVALPFGKALQERLTISLPISFLVTHRTVVAVVGVLVKRRSHRVVVALASVFGAFSQTVVITVLLCDAVNIVSVSAVVWIRVSISAIRRISVAVSAVWI